MRRGSRLGRQTATLIEQVRAQHNTRRDGAATTYPDSVLIPEGTPTETQGERAAAETRWRLYLPRGVPDYAAAAVCTVVPGPVDADGNPARLAVAGPAQPYWDRRGRFSHTELVLRQVLS